MVIGLISEMIGFLLFKTFSVYFFVLCTPITLGTGYRVRAVIFLNFFFFYFMAWIVITADRNLTQKNATSTQHDKPSNKKHLSFH